MPDPACAAQGPPHCPQLRGNRPELKKASPEGPACWQRTGPWARTRLVSPHLQGRTQSLAAPAGSRESVGPGASEMQPPWGPVVLEIHEGAESLRIALWGQAVLQATIKTNRASRWLC